MRIGIVGAGASGIFLALKLKDLNDKIDVTLIDQKEKIGKKLYATGNGKCNLGNVVLNSNSYNLDVSKIVNENSIEDVFYCFEKWGIPLKQINNLIYPYSESAKEIMDILNSLIKSKGIKVILDTKVNDYHINDRVVLTVDKGELSFDCVVIASGGKSSSQFGSDGSILSILKKHGYDITTLRPGLCPIKTREKTQKMQGLRIKGDASLIFKGHTIAKESGEILFKKDGLSGIAIFNISSLISRNNINDNYSISIDCFPKFSINDLVAYFRKMNENSKSFCFLYGFFVKPIADDILSRINLQNKCFFNEKEIENIAKICKNYAFTYDSLYDFNDSQVTVGGVSLLEIDDDFKSIKEDKIFLCGEVLDVDGLSGGYNLLWSFISAWKVAVAICNI